MIDALAAFDRLLKSSHNGAIATDPTTFNLADGLYRLAQELEDKLRFLDEGLCDKAAGIRELLRDLESKRQERERKTSQEIDYLRRQLQTLQTTLERIEQRQIDGR
jgi:hypothetical protein